jgi:hypothetical protein
VQSTFWPKLHLEHISERSFERRLKIRALSSAFGQTQQVKYRCDFHEIHLSFMKMVNRHSFQMHIIPRGQEFYAHATKYENAFSICEFMVRADTNAHEPFAFDFVVEENFGNTSKNTLNAWLCGDCELAKFIKFSRF